MFGALSIYLLLLVNVASAGVSKNVAEDLPENFKEDLASYIASIQEWNQLIPQKFRDLPQALLGAGESFDFESMNAKLNSLEFGALNSHLAALHKSRRVRRYMAAKRRIQRRLLA
ncbi:MAG: hypothetical protein ABIQ95_01175, partial [Bdellovibrionia bacterium]